MRSTISATESPLIDDVRPIAGVHRPQRLADRVDHLHLVPGRRQAAGEIGDGERRRPLSVKAKRPTTLGVRISVAIAMYEIG